MPLEIVLSEYIYIPLHILNRSNVALLCFITNILKIIHIYIIYFNSFLTSWSKSIAEYDYSLAFCILPQKHESKYSSLKFFIFLLAYMFWKCKYQEVLFKDIIWFSTNVYDSQKCYCIFWKKTGGKVFNQCIKTFMKTFEESAIVTMAVLWQK